MSHLWIRRRRWRLTERRVGADLDWLHVVACDTGERRQFLHPAEAVTPARTPPARTVARHQALARVAGHLARTRLAFTPTAVVGANLALHAFQLEPALAAAAGRRRILIADAVGLGKTVQAGLIAAQTLERRPDARVLIITPAGLLPQWRAELAARLALTAVIVDADHLRRRRAQLPYLDSPWLQPGLWLASGDFLKQPHVADGLPDRPWDLVVADEAHVLAGDSDRHDVIDQIAHAAHHVVLLTATPHDGDGRRFRRLLAIGTRGAGDGLTVFARQLRPTGPDRRTTWLKVRTTDAEARLLDLITRFQRQGAGDGARSPGLGLICDVFRRRWLSSPEALTASIDRRMLVLRHAPDDAERQLALFPLDLLDADEAAALDGDTGLTPSAERRWLRRLRALSASGRAGGRQRTLARLLRRTHDHVVVFTQYRDTLMTLNALVPPERRVALIHGGLTASEQHRAVVAFQSGHVDTLLATDVASQGLNLQQAARWIIAFDVPATPLRLEQRIGRVDRLGQTRRVHATVFTSRLPADVLLRRRLDGRDERLAADQLTGCTRWLRAAVGLAAWFDGLRVWARCWRTESSPAAVRVRVEPGQLRRWLGRPAETLICAVARLTSASGGELERRVVVYADDRGRLAVEAQLARRARVIEARLRHRRTVDAARLPGRRSDTQPSLFVASRPATSEPTAADVATVRVEPLEIVAQFVTKAGA